MIGRWLLQTVSAHHFRWIAALGASLLLTAALLVVASPLRASTPLGAMLPGPTLDHTPAAPPAPSGQGEGIQVHGEWLIEVVNPDGTLATQRAFKNALTTGANGGAELLARLLARDSLSVGTWAVALNSAASDTLPCVVTSGGQLVTAVCVAVEPNGGSVISPYVGNAHNFPTLSVSAPTTGPDAGKLILKGTVTADKSGEIWSASTFNRWCNAASAPATPCQGGSYDKPVTFKALQPPVKVSDGQIVDVTVVISFS